MVNILLVTGSFLMASIGREALQFVVQYASKKFFGRLPNPAF
jgi:hypothetical protein